MNIKVPIYSLKLVRERFAGYPAGIGEDVKTAAAFFHEMIGSADREHCAALFLDSVGRPTGSTIIGIGTLAKVSLHAREVFKTAIVANADSILLAHNHPAGLPLPSPGDIRMTRRLVCASRHIGISLKDHFIVCPSGAFTSMREAGVMEVAA